MALPPDPRELDRLRHAIAAMPEPTRTIFWLNAHDRLDYHAIADRLGISLEGVERHIAKAALHLSRTLDG